MKYFLFAGIILLFPFVFAETTFFDNPDYVFIIDSSKTSVATGGITGGTTEITTSGGSCLYKWNCTEWSKCFLSWEQTRSCINIGTCSDKYKTPKIKQNCTKVEMSGKIILEEIKDKNLFYFILVPGIILFIFYLKKIINKKTEKLK